MRALTTLLALLAFSAAPCFAASKPKKASLAPPQEKPFDLKTASFKEILDRYVFIADFNQKSPERPISDEVFWKYPFKLPPVKFEIDTTTYDLRKLVFQMRGSGRLMAMYNDGRAAFLDKEYSKASEIWFAGRQEFKNDASVNKTLEFFLGVNALAFYQQKISDLKNPPSEKDIDGLLKQVSYFFASVFILRRDVPIPAIDVYAPWALYNIAAIYQRFDRMPSVYGAATEGLAALLKDGKSLHRSELRQLIAEAHIKNQDMLSAVQELDTALRQDPNPGQATRIFNRAGDIYYDLNNYELAEDMYGMANALGRESRVYNAAQAVLRGETAFWLGKFEEADRMLSFALDAAMRVPGHDWLQDSQTLPWVTLRLADTYLARASAAKDKKRNELFAKARLAYFNTQTNYPNSEAARLAEIRGACLELPTYAGNNVKHARELLKSVKEKNDVPEQLMELVWACHAKSYSSREKTDEMVELIKEFSDKYPRSKHLASMIDPVRDVQAAKIDSYFEKKQWESATEFFEQRRSSLFPKISDKLASKLWNAYVATSRSKEAEEFWRPKLEQGNTDLDVLRRAAFLYEAGNDRSKNKDVLSTERRNLDQRLLTRAWGEKPSKEEVDYVGRVLASSRASSAYPWVLKLQDQWTKNDPESGCSVLFPLLSRIQSDKKARVLLKNELVRRTKEFGDSKLAELREKDPACFQSWVDLEARILPPSKIDETYSARKDWPLTGAWLERSWAWSEDLNLRGKVKDAREIWQRIAESAPKESFEYKMAKTRLDPSRTEYESLWR
jgi:tetratricopeptide (TPR) repeat protein